MNRLEILAPDGLPEVEAGADLAALVRDAVDLSDGDIVVVTSKVVSKAEGRVRRMAREQAVDEETLRLVARRGGTRIVRNRLGLTMAAAGVDASNVAADHVVLLPLDPDASARRLREQLPVNVGVIITDTAGRAWRDGQTDLAIGAAGLRVVEDFAGSVDPHGNPLVVTRPAVADEIAGAAELAQGKLAARPLAVLRGRSDLVLSPGDHGAGARSLIRPEGADLFGLGAREAVIQAVAGDPSARSVFGAPVPLEELAPMLADALGADLLRRPDGSATVTVPTTAAGGVPRLHVVCFALGWEVVESSADPEVGVEATIRPVTP